MIITLTPELAGVGGLGILAMYLLRELGKVSRQYKYAKSLADNYRMGLHVSYKALDETLATVHTTHPEVADRVGEIFTEKMTAEMAKVEALLTGEGQME